MRTATVEGTLVRFYTVRQRMVMGKPRNKLIPGWFIQYTSRSKALAAARAWKNGIRIRHER